MAALTFAKSFASLAFGIVENARRMSPERTIVMVSKILAISLIEY